MHTRSHSTTMANIRTESNRHRWSYRPLPSLPGAHEMKKQGQVKRGYLCMNCRQAWDPDNGDPPVTGCLLDNNAMLLGKSRMHDLTRQEQRLLAEQGERERQADIALGAMTKDGRTIFE